uniref:Mediator of RNA polymerase II transcription subunit 29 n=2 Tax=Haemonchus contortus TaxID=6289 RepID=A0A7I4YBZ7_HAECO
MSGQQGYGQPPNMQQQQMMYNQQHMMGRQMGQMGVQRQMYAQDSGMPQQQGQMQMHFTPQQQQQMQMGQPQMGQMPQLQAQQQQQQPPMGHQQQMQMGLQQQLGGQQMGMQQQQQQMVQQQQLGPQQQTVQQQLSQQPQQSIGQQPMHSSQPQLTTILGSSLQNVSQQHMQMQQPRSPMTSSVGPQQLTPGGGPGSQAPGSTLAVASAGGPTSVGPMSVQPHTPMNPASQQTIPQPSSVQQGPASVPPGTPASNQPAPQSSSTGEPTHPYLQDPVAHSKQLIMKDLRFSIIDLNRRAGEALKDLRAGNVPSNSKEYLKAMDNLFAVCDEIEGNLILVCETQKQMSKMEKIFDKDALKEHVGFSDSKGRHGAEDDSGANLAAINAYIDQTKQLQAAFDRAFSHVGRTLETIRRRQNMGLKNTKLEPMDM